jgi:hypothetical protein
MRRQVLASAVPLAPADRPLSEAIDLVMADRSALVKSGRPARYARAGFGGASLTRRSCVAATTAGCSLRRPRRRTGLRRSVR